MTNMAINLYELFCCITSSFHEQAFESPEQVVSVTNACFTTNITYMHKLNFVFYLLSNESFKEEQCHETKQCDASAPMTTTNFVYHVLMILFMAITVISNIFVIFAIFKTNFLRRNIANLFILSLAFSDFFVAVTVFPIKIISYFDNMDFCSGIEWCRFHITTDNVFFSISITNLLVIAVDRYIALHYPYLYPNLLDRTKAKIIIAVTWAYGTIWGLLANIRWDDIESPSIRIDKSLCETNKNSYYVYSAFLLVFFIPVVVMGVLYLRILLIAKKHARGIASSTHHNNNYHTNSQQTEDSTHLTDQLASQKTSSEESKNSSFKKLLSSSITQKFHTTHYFRMMVKASKTVATVYGTFVLAWSPVCIISLVLVVCSDCLSLPTQGRPWYIVVLVDFLPVMSSMANPFIYAIFNKQYRKAFQKIISKYTKKFNCLDVNIKSKKRHAEESHELAAI